MKKIIICLATLLSISYLNAQNQTEKGNFLLGGGINYSFQNYNNNGLSNQYYNNLTRQNTFKINPNIGYFIDKNVALGAELFYSNNQQKSNYNYNPIYDPAFSNYEQLSTTNTFGIGVFVNYYVPITDKLSFLLNSSVGFANSKLKTEYSNNNRSEAATGNSFGLAVSPGLVYFVSPKLSLQTKFADLHYTSTKTSQDGSNLTTNSDDFGIGTDLSTLLFGINYYFK